MNVVQMAINRAMREIPYQILEDCFIKRDRFNRMSPTSIEERIRSEVIKKMVLPDLNVENGVVSLIPLANCPVERTVNFTQIYTIPKELTGGRAILTALSIEYLNPYMAMSYNYGYPTCGVSMINRANMDLQQAIAGAPVTSNSRVDLINENTILVYDASIYPTSCVLRCILENDEELSNIRPRSIPTFTNLIVLAIKAYIYNEMVIQIDAGRLVGGHELGKYGEILQGYEGALEEYYTLLHEKIGKLFVMNSKETMNRKIRWMLGGRR